MSVSQQGEYIVHQVSVFRNSDNF